MGTTLKIKQLIIDNIYHYLNTLKGPCICMGTLRLEVGFTVYHCAAFSTNYTRALINSKICWNYITSKRLLIVGSKTHRANNRLQHRIPMQPDIWKIFFDPIFIILQNRIFWVLFEQLFRHEIGTQTLDRKFHRERLPLGYLVEFFIMNFYEKIKALKLEQNWTALPCFYCNK